MAQTRRAQTSSAAVYRMHANEARENFNKTRLDAAKTAFAASANHHDTAARLTERAPKLRVQAMGFRAAAAAAMKGRRKQPGTAARMLELAVQHETAAAACAPNAERHHQAGLQHGLVGKHLHEACDITDEYAIRHVISPRKGSDPDIEEVDDFDVRAVDRAAALVKSKQQAEAIASNKTAYIPNIPKDDVAPGSTAGREE